MKLRTEMKDSGYGTIEPRLKLGDNGGAVFHDAACAHALMLALSEWLGVSTNDECAGNVVTWIYHRADEIMTGWHFDSGEVG